MQRKDKDYHETERVHLVVDFVFTKLESYRFDNADTRLEALLKPLLLDAFLSMDTMATAGILSHGKAVPLLRMMQVLVCKAANPIQIPELQAVMLEGGVDFAVESLISFAQELRVLNQSPTEETKNNEKMERIISDDETSQGDSLEKKMKDLASEYQRKQRDGLNHVEEEEESFASAPTPAIQLIKDVLKRCCYFLSLQELGEQVTVLKIMSDSFQRLAKSNSIFLPAIHEAWPSLMARFVDQVALLIANNESGPIAQDDEKYKLRTTTDTNVTHSTMLNNTGNIQSIKNMQIQRHIFPENTQRRKMMLLPHLLDLFTLLAATSKDFFGIKFQDDLWPQLVKVLKIIAKIPKDAKSGSASSLRRSDLVVFNSKQLEMNTKVVGFEDEAKNNEIEEDFLLLRKSRSVDEKLKRAVIECLLRFASLPDCEPYVRQIAGACAWLLLPLAMTGQEHSIINLAVETLAALIPLDVPFVSAILQSIVGTGSLLKKNEQNELWLSVATDPRVTRIYGSSCHIAPESSILFDAMTKDSLLVSRLNGILDQSFPLFTHRWRTTVLQQFSHAS